MLPRTDQGRTVPGLLLPHVQPTGRGQGLRPPLAAIPQEAKDIMGGNHEVHLLCFKNILLEVEESIAK